MLLLCSVASLPKPETTFVRLAVWYCGIFGASVELKSTVNIASAIKKDDYLFSCSFRGKSVQIWQAVVDLYLKNFEPNSYLFTSLNSCKDLQDTRQPARYLGLKLPSCLTNLQIYRVLIYTSKQLLYSKSANLNDALHVTDMLKNKLPRRQWLFNPEKNPLSVYKWYSNLSRRILKQHCVWQVNNKK